MLHQRKNALFACLVMLPLGVWSLSAQNGSGLRPRPAPADYQASQETLRATYAASLLPADQVKHLFTVDISKQYVVVEVALFPNPAEPEPNGVKL